MTVERNERGFEVLKHIGYPAQRVGVVRLAQQSSAVLDYPDALERPGTSALWIGKDHHLGREEVAQLVTMLPASYDKRFRNSMCDVDRLTDAQRSLLWQLVWRYRRQIRESDLIELARKRKLEPAAGAPRA